MFDLFRRMPILSIGWFFDKDETAGGAGNPDDSTEDDPTKGKDPSNAGDPPDPKAEKKFSQAELDAIIADRLAQERRQSEKAAEKARRKAEEEALAKNQEWQTLAETRANEIADLTKERDELAAYRDQADRYRQALETQLATVKKGLPKHIAELIEKLDPVDQLTYISTHARELAVQPSGYGETPDPKQRKLNPDEETGAQKASRSIVTNNF